jgi:uncharacterized protein (TIGR03084 family)
MASPSSCSKAVADAAALAGVCTDLTDEHDALDAVVANLPSADWDRLTPAEGWAVRDQISHLAWVDERAVEAVSDPEAFLAGVARLREVAPEDPMSVGVNEGRAMAAADVLAWWRRARDRLLVVMGDVDPNARVVWYGPPMGAVSFVTARLMETWAHGQDVVDALGATRPATARLRHVAHIGVTARPFSFAAHGLESPSDPVRVELRGPSGDEWTWGPAGAPDRVRGDALEFCLVVTQRRHLVDTGLDVRGPVATQWMTIAQAFAGPPGSGRQPGQFGTSPGPGRPG